MGKNVPNHQTAILLRVFLYLRQWPWIHRECYRTIGRIQCQDNVIGRWGQNQLCSSGRIKGCNKLNILLQCSVTMCNEALIITCCGCKILQYYVYEIPSDSLSTISYAGCDHGTYGIVFYMEYSKAGQLLTDVNSWKSAISAEFTIFSLILERQFHFFGTHSLHAHISPNSTDESKGDSL